MYVLFLLHTILGRGESSMTHAHMFMAITGRLEGGEALKRTHYVYLCEILEGEGLHVSYQAIGSLASY